MSTKKVEHLEAVIIRFAGDSGDGMQLTGDRFTSETAMLGNDLATFPDFPAEIRAPAGSLPGVSGFQVHFADHDILTAGDRPDVLVAMNPAALKANVRDVPKGATIIVDTDAFNDRTLQKAGYPANPLEDGSLHDYHLHEVALTSMTVGALKGIEGVTPREAERSKNFFALGLMSWLYHRPTDGTIDFISKKFAKRPEIVEANTRAFRAGWNYGETSEDFAVSYEIAPAPLAPGTYRQITGNTAISYGLIAAAKLAKLPLFLGAYPITPASSILEELAGRKEFGVVTFQAEDEIAAVGAAVGAAFGGALGVTASAGPGIVLKAETVGLAIALELPLLILDIQRAGPSTGMPTKPEQADLLMGSLGATARAPSRSSRRRLRRSASTRRSRQRASRSSTASPCTSSPTPTWRTARSPGSSPTWATCRTSRRASPRRTASRSSRTAATPRPSPGRGPSPAPLVSSIGSAGSRRPTSPAPSPTTLTTTTRWCGCGRRRSPGSRRTSPSSPWTIPTGTRSSSWSAGDRRTARSRPACGARGGRASASRRPTCST